MPPSFNDLIMPKLLLTDQQKHDILELFFRTELYIGEKIIDNSDKYIAEELGLNTKTVSWFLHSFLLKKENKLNNKINKNERN